MTSTAPVVTVSPRDCDAALMVVSHRASIDVPAPGGSKRRASRYSLLSGGDFAR